MNKDDEGWTAEFDSYICTDSYGRDSISWLKYMGGKSNQTVGDYKKVIHSQDDLEDIEDLLRTIAKEQVDYLISLRDAKAV